jgi:hypothetical protein
MPNRPVPGQDGRMRASVQSVDYVCRQEKHLGQVVQITVPAWTCRDLSQFDRSQPADLLDVLPRCELWKKDTFVPVHLQAVRRFHSHAAPFPCELPLSLQTIHRTILDVCEAHLANADILAGHLADYFGAVGTNENMRSLMEQLCEFWDWEN